MNAILIGCLLTALGAGSAFTLDESRAKAAEWGFCPPEAGLYTVTVTSFTRSNPDISPQVKPSGGFRGLSFVSPKT